MGHTSACCANAAVQVRPRSSSPSRGAEDQRELRRVLNEAAPVEDDTSEG